jgi:hypothetical protein
MPVPGQTSPCVIGPPITVVIYHPITNFAVVNCGRRPSESTAPRYWLQSRQVHVEDGGSPVDANCVKSLFQGSVQFFDALHHTTKSTT